MKLQLTQNNVTVTIEAEGDCQSTYEMGQYFRDLLERQGYKKESVHSALPDEEDIDNIVDHEVRVALYGY